MGQTEKNTNPKERGLKTGSEKDQSGGLSVLHKLIQFQAVNLLVPRQVRQSANDYNSKTSVAPRGDHLLNPSNEPKVPDEIAVLVENLLLEVNKAEAELDIHSVLWDFGGQSVYYVTHPLFLTPRAMYLLVCDLSRKFA